jgi:DNA-binding NtrC family response regulator
MWRRSPAIEVRRRTLRHATSMNRPATGGAHELVGQSPQIDAVRRLIDKASRNRLSVLLLGESGTGKEVVARAIHHAGLSGQFVPVDCGALVGTLMESELFGHVRGSFTGATQSKKGLVELADGGTAFFDEIGDLPLEMQVKLLRLVQEREFRAVGALEWRKVDLRVISATHRNLTVEVAAGRFRQDLYYRLNVFPIHLPPLREHKRDIPLLMEHFLEKIRPPGGARLSPSPDIVKLLISYDWPGNVRELEHCVSRMAALQSGGAMQMADLPTALQFHRSASAMEQLAGAIDGEPEVEFQLVSDVPVMPLPETVRRAISRALSATGGERSRAARLLKIGRTTLYRKMKEYGMK